MKFPKGFVFRKATIRDIETIIEPWQKCRIDEGTSCANHTNRCAAFVYGCGMCSCVDSFGQAGDDGEVFSDKFFG